MELTNKNILVTGGSGFIGSHLVESLTQTGITPVIIVRSIDSRSYFLHKHLNKKGIIVTADINNFFEVRRILFKYQIQIIFHLAAQTLVETAYIDPHETLCTNIMGTVNILEAARTSPAVEAVIVASSDKAYGKKGKTKYREKDALSGDHPYEVSKSCADLIAQMYHKTYKLPVAITRCGNIYGEGDLNFSRIIPGIMRSIIRDETLNIRSNGKYIRDYVYVKDIVSAYLALIKNWHLSCGQSFNIGSTESMTVLDLIKLIGDNLNIKIKYKISNNAVNEIPFQRLNYSKIRNSISWRTKYKLTKTIPQIYNWYNNYFKSE